MVLRRIALVGAVLIVGGCSLARENLLPALTGEEPSAKPSQASANQPSPSGVPSSGAASEPGAPQGSSSTENTAVGQKIDEMNAAVPKLEGSVSMHENELRSVHGEIEGTVQEYRKLAAQIDADLEAGAAPGNPALLNRWDQARNALEKIGGALASMKTLHTALLEDYSLAIDLLQSARAAYGMPSADDTTDRQLALIEDRLDKAIGRIERLSNGLDEETSRQSIYLARERGNLATLSAAIKNGGPSGASLARRVRSSATPLAVPAAPDASVGIGGRRPLVVIRFIRPNVEYEQALYTAVSQALARKPNAQFDLVAVAPGKAANDPLAADQSKRNADAVMQALTGMGLPANRVTLSATTSNSADGSEVHLYVR